jgi:hypothetical protein
LLPLILWQDLWNGQVPEQSFPELFSFAKDSTVTISKARNAVSLDQLFFEPLSEIIIISGLTFGAMQSTLQLNATKD